MKIKLLVLMLLTSVLSLAQENTLTSLVVLMKDGTTSTFELATKPLVTFDASNLKIQGEGTDATIALSEIVRYWFKTCDASGITEKDTDQSSIDYREGVLVLSSVKAGTKAEVFATDGRLVKALTTNHDGTFRLSLSQLPTGVYIVKVNCHTLKVMKR